MSALGYQWLQEHFGLPPYPLPVRSLLGSRLSDRHETDGRLTRVYPPTYAPEESPIGHLEFALKYDGIHLPMLAASFRAMGPGPVAALLAAHPTSKYARLLGFYYEFCTGNELDPELTVGGNYIQALDPAVYVTRPGRKVPRWRVENNLPGTPAFCPLIRRDARIPEASDDGLARALGALVSEFPQDLLDRAVDYLYLKETKSTYRIENEDVPPHDRKVRFLKLLQSAGQDDLGFLMSEAGLTACQGAIVDPRYAEDSFRDDQNYVGETLAHRERVHYICPPPEQLRSLMAGLRQFALDGFDLHPVVHAAVTSFGFVFMHPLDDGNGRLHRFLIHDVLQRRHLTPPGVLLPVSAAMLRDMRRYDSALETFSRPLVNDLAQYEVAQNGMLRFFNGTELADYYRFPDMTGVVHYLFETIEACIQEDFADELRTLRSFDAARTAVQAIVDLPARKMDQMLKFLFQNQGRLARHRRGDFAELSDVEIQDIEVAFREAFGWMTTPQAPLTEEDPSP